MRKTSLIAKSNFRKRGEVLPRVQADRPVSPTFFEITFGKCRRRLAMFLSVWVAWTSSAPAATVVLQPSADTFLSEFSPTNNVGAHTDLAAGTVNNGTRTRALLRFDLAAAVPVGATVTAASLKLTVARLNAGGGVNSTFDLRRVLAAWNEGVQTGNLGASAKPSETTWSHRLFPGTPWSIPGGANGVDFAATVSAAQLVSGLGVYEFTGAGLAQDVQFWLEHPETNLGWVLLTELEGTRETSRRFGSREDKARAPALTIDYTLPASPFRITGLTVTENQAALTWTNGLPSYQVQTRSSFDQNWINIGPPTNGTTAVVPLTDSPAFFRVVSENIPP